MKELVFNKRKWMKSIGKKEYRRAKKIAKVFNAPCWADICNGKTKQECERLGYLIADEWCKYE